MIKRLVFLELRKGPVPEASLEIERDGFTAIRGAFSADEIGALRDEVARVYDELPSDRRNSRLSEEENDQYRYEMLNRSERCLRTVVDRRLLDVVEPLLGDDCHVIANTAWRNPAGMPMQHGGGNWHVDAGPHVPRPADVAWDDRIPYPVFAVGVHVMLEDCPLASGPTGFIRRSHRSGQHPPFDRLVDPDLEWDGQRAEAISAKAGDVVMFSSDVWHRRMPPAKGDTGRFFLQIHYGRRDLAQRLRTTNQVNHLAPQTRALDLDDRERAALGLHLPLFYDG